MALSSISPSPSEKCRCQMRARQRSTRVTIVAAIVVAGGLLISLSGCSSSSGLSPLAARDAVEKAPGVESATVATAVDRETLGTSYSIDVRVELHDGLSSAEQQRLVDRAAATGWATDIHHEPYGLRPRVTSSPSVDVWKVLQGLGVASAPAPNDKSSVLISAKDMDEKWGDWPARAPS